MHILLVEDDPKIAKTLLKGLSQAGHTMTHCADAETGLTAARAHRHCSYVVDVQLPGMDGLSMIETLRQAGDWTPALILSALQTVDDRIQGLAKGGDDYLTKPFVFAELLARLDALVRRQTHAAAPAALAAHGLHLDLVLRRATYDGNPFQLQPLEFALLAYLMRHEGQVVSRQQVMEQVWNYRFDPKTNLVEMRISCLRDKLAGAGAPSLIHTVRGAGYAFHA